MDSHDDDDDDDDDDDMWWIIYISTAPHRFKRFLLVAAF